MGYWLGPAALVGRRHCRTVNLWGLEKTQLGGAGKVAEAKLHQKIVPGRQRRQRMKTNHLRTNLTDNLLR
jgi:hypothetical protein